MPGCSGPNPRRDRGTHSCPDAFGFIRRMVACWLWRRFLDFLRKVKQDSLGFIFIGAKIAPDLFFSGTGSHYNPVERVHPKHAGDLPPLLECQGNAYLSIRTDRFSVSDVVGRTVVIHSDPDDFHSQPAGNAGMKIGCGVIYKRR